MGRRLRMTAELSDWLTELGESQPATAAEVGAALLAVLECAETTALAIVGEPSTLRSPDPRDFAFQQVREKLQLIGRSLADVANARHRAELQLSLKRAEGADAAQLAELEHHLATAQRQEDQISWQRRLLQGQADTLRTAMEVAKATRTAAAATLRIAEALQAAGGEPEPDLAQLRTDLRAAEEKLLALRAPSLRAGAVSQPAPQPVPGLLGLRADPLGSDIRILFAVEPADTVTLLAVLEGPEAVSEHGAEAIRLASDLLTEIRAGGWPADINEVVLGDPDAFRARFFPADDGSLRRRAAVLAQTRPLRERREDLHLSIAEVAVRSGLSADRVAAIEREGVRTARVHEAVALTRALCIRLELPLGPGPAVT